MKQLIEDYERRLETVRKELKDCPLNIEKNQGLKLKYLVIKLLSELRKVKIFEIDDKVLYDNFGNDFIGSMEVYRVKSIEKDGYLIGNETTRPFFAYKYQIKLAS